MTRARGRSSGTMRPVAAASGCRSVPIEGFLYDASPLDMPPMTSCATAMRPLGMTRGRIAPRPGRAGGTKATTIVALGRDDRARMLSGVFGHAVTTGDLEGAYSGMSRSGVRVEARTMRVFKSKIQEPGVDDVTIECELRIGSHSGKLVHRYFREKKSGIVGDYLELFDLDESTPKELGQGVGESVTRNTILWNMKHGIAEIALQAAWVGRYVWATFGFDWADGSVRREKADELAEYLEGHEDAFDVNRGVTLQGQFKVSGSGAIRTIANGVSKSAWMLASLHLPGIENDQMYHVGKLFLIGVKDPRDPRRYIAGESGAEDWHGALVLKPGHPTFERARLRLKL